VAGLLVDILGMAGRTNQLQGIVILLAIAVVVAIIYFGALILFG